MSENDILFEIRGTLGLVTLNRPAALNALTHDMALRLEKQLLDWRDSDAVALVAIRGAGEKAFCAGGDIRVLYDAGRPGGERGAANWGFYADEYRLNTLIKRYPKPYVALMDGIVMGGGVGVSIHGSRRVAGDRTLFAMPETGIGLFPDVGGTWFLPRMPGRTGMFAGLTGARFGPADAVAAGVCDCYVPTVRHGELTEALAAIAPSGESIHVEVDKVIDGFAEHPADPTPIADRQRVIEALFSGETVEAVLAALDAEAAAEGEAADWAAKQAKIIRAKSPTCTRIAHRQITEGARLDFEACMTLEYRLARFCMTAPDFYEGVRAVIIDKDNAPRWSPATLQEADAGHVDGAFAPLGAEDLRF